VRGVVLADRIALEVLIVGSQDKDRGRILAEHSSCGDIVGNEIVASLALDFGPSAIEQGLALGWGLGGKSDDDRAGI
jgi:hypothetical protein